MPSKSKRVDHESGLGDERTLPMQKVFQALCVCKSAFTSASSTPPMKPSIACQGYAKLGCSTKTKATLKDRSQ